MMQRRSFLGAILAGLSAPAIASASSLMPLARIHGVLPLLVGDGKWDDGPALQAFVDGRPFRMASGAARLSLGPDGSDPSELSGHFSTAGPVVCNNRSHRVIRASTIEALPGLGTRELIRFRPDCFMTVTDCAFYGNGATHSCIVVEAPSAGWQTMFPGPVRC
jgi:hypothetical protein